MILDSIKSYKRYSGVHKDWDKAFELIGELLSQPLPTEKSFKKSVGDIKLVIQNYKTMEAEEKRFEGHKKCIDIQFLVKGFEVIGYADGKALDVLTPYSEERDHMQFQDTDGFVPLALGESDYAVFFPMEAHKTQCKLRTVTDAVKIIVKLPVEAQ